MKKYRYSASIKSKIADELLNTYFIRPFAGLFVNLIFNTRIKPIQVVLLGSIPGILSAVFFIFPGYHNLLIGAILLFVKNISDAVDGQLARAKDMVDRRGRFLDSIADIIINFLVFTSLSYRLYLQTGQLAMFILGLFAFLSLTFRVSYFVFYVVSYMKLGNKMKSNRVIEDITEEDQKGDKTTLFLQKIFNLLYTWQDKIIFKIDIFSKRSDNKKIIQTDFDYKWYSDKISLRLNNFIGLGTELTLLILACIIDQVYLYLLINVFLLNFYLLFLILYRKLYLSKNA
jgi:phosphatidylglycerophosphate synthase